MEENRSYGIVQPTPEHSRWLLSNVLSAHELQKAGYILAQLPRREIERKKRCQQCCKALKKEYQIKPEMKTKLPLAPISGAASSNAAESQSLGTASGAATQEALNNEDSQHHVAETDRPSENFWICKFHTGFVTNKVGELENNWRFHETSNVALPTHVAAVAIDCEMGTASSGESELIRLSLVDFFTGTVLIDTLVYPSVRMSHYNTRFSGVSRQAMNEARRNSRCIFGRDAARDAVYKFVGPNTIVVGHAGHQDLSSLRWIHRLVVDTLLVETKRRQMELWYSKSSSVEGNGAEADGVGNSSNKHDEPGVMPKEGGLSLRALTLKRLNRFIQIGGRGHDSLEDALATRDLLHWYIANPVSEAA
ncbi:hypothetical protein QQS21_001845 [Conoideocrella luteorostrata]|uniref:Exonuclease domain-containing protein n=1 Tax=Conoideocrella luteorostrata TaxID=1105319 RepID=A0AAJ0CWA3_9HYPO|nr:hypothetical protein QQS21_001845 [Conoideocrella luteorostrata]